VRLLHAAAENRREEAGELHGVPVLLGGGLGGGVEAEGEGEWVVPAVEAGAANNKITRRIARAFARLVLKIQKISCRCILT